MDEWVALLFEKDANKAYQAMKILEQKSQESSQVYVYIDYFINMLESEHSYIRTRGLILVAANAKWDSDGKIDEIVDDYAKYIVDEKPITARKCLQTLPLLVKAKPYLKHKILHMLETADLSKYNDTMLPLLYKDICKIVKEIKKI